MANRRAKVKPPTSPAPRSDGRAGFTFIEVLIAIVVAGLLIGVSSVSLITSLRAEQQAAWLRDAVPLIRQVSVRTWIGALADEPLAAPEWDVSRSTATTDNGTWVTWTLSPAQRPSLRIMLAVRP